jgi:hypothetical protein
MNTTEQRTGAASLLAASEIKGARVINFQNQDVGDIDELLIRQMPVDQVRRCKCWRLSWLGSTSGRTMDGIQIVNERGRVRKMLDATRERLEKRRASKATSAYAPPMLPNLSLSWDVEWTAER